MVLIAPFVPPEFGLIYSSSNVKLKLGHKIIDTGTLYISQSSLAWQPAHSVDGICISWRQVSLHGISTSPTKCIYFMLDHKIQWRGVYEEGAGDGGMLNGNGAAALADAVPANNDCDVDEGNATDEEDAGGDDAAHDEEEQMTECWLLPDDLNTVDTIFQAMTECQALHPDSADSVSDESDFMDDEDDDDDDGNNAERYGPNAANGGDDVANGAMRNLNINDERFTDADE